MNNKYVIELSEGGEFDSEWDSLASLHDSLIRIVEQLGLVPSGPKTVDIRHGLIVRTDHQALGTILGALAGDYIEGIEMIGIEPPLDEIVAAGLPKRKHHSQEKNYECPSCHKMVGTLVKATGICKPCHMLARKNNKAQNAEAEKCQRCQRQVKLTRSGFCNDCNFKIAEERRDIGPQEMAIEAISRPRPRLKISNLKGRKF